MKNRRIGQPAPWAAIVVLLVWACAQPAGGEDWPQVQHDAAHTGWTPDEPKPPYKLLWWRDLKEPTATAAAVIVARGKVFVTTDYGRLYALDRSTGKTAWVYKTGGAILGAAAAAGDSVYVNSMDRRCHAVRIADGQPEWTFETGEGIWAAPVVADGKVFVAGRDRFVYALAAESGRELWKAPIPNLVMNTPAYADAALYVAGGDMHVYAFDGGSGKLKWKSPKIPGAAMREYWLTAAHGTVILTTQYAFGRHHMGRMIEKAVTFPYHEAHKNDPVLRDQELFDEFVQWFRAHPQQKTLLVLDAKTGREKYVTPVITVNGGSCIGPMPAVAPDGYAYTVYANCRLCASGWAFFGRLKLETGKLEPLITDRYAPLLAHPKSWHWEPKAGTTFGRTSTWDGGFSVIDQSWGVSMGGGIAFAVRDPGWPGNPPFYNTYSVRTRTDKYLLAGRGHRRLSEANLGTLGGGQMHNTCSPVAVSDKQLFHKSSRSVIFAFEGK